MSKFIIILIRLIIFYYPSYWLLDLFACEHICCFCCLWSSLGWFQTHTPSIIQKYIFFVFNFSPFISFFTYFVLMPTKLSVRRKKSTAKWPKVSWDRKTDLKTDRLFCLSEICVYCFVHDKYTVYFADTYKALFLGSIHYMLLILFFFCYIYLSEWVISIQKYIQYSWFDYDVDENDVGGVGRIIKWWLVLFFNLL